MNKGMPILLAALFVLILSVSSSAQILSCTVSQGPCSSGVDVFHISGQTNAHAELPTQYNYGQAGPGYRICCTGVPGLGNSCSGTQGTNYDVVFRLSGQTNAHAEQGGMSTLAYNGNDVCLSISDGSGVHCTYYQNRCPFAYDCLAAMSGTTNAHLSSCDVSAAYPTWVCCFAGEMPERIEFTGIPPSWTSSSANVDIDCRDDDSDCDPNTLKMRIHSSDPGECPEDYSGYGIDPPMPRIDNHVWVCAAGQDRITKNHFFSDPKEILVDQVLPTVSHNYQYDGQWVTSPQRITFSPQDGGDSGIDGVFYCFGTGCEPDTRTEVDYYTDIDYSHEGVFRYKVVDRAGNPSPTGQLNLKIDVNAPVTTDNTESDSAWYSYSFYVELECTDDLSGCEDTFYCEYEQGSNPCTSFQPGAGFTVTCQDRCYKIIRYYSTDNAGGVEQAKDSNVIRMDAALPSCTMDSLPDYTPSPEIQLSWTGDSETIDTYEIRYKMDGGNFQTWQTFNHPTATATFTGQENHEYTFECIPTNEFNTGASFNRPSTFIDTLLPESWLIVPAWSNSSVFEVVWDGDDFGGSGISEFSIEWREGAGSWDNWLNTGSTSAMFGQGGNPTSVQNGDTFDFRVMATDNVGNAGGYSQASQTGIDLVPPGCQMGNLNDYTTSNDFEISWSGSDPDSGIAGYDVMVNDGIDWQYTIQDTDLTEKTFSGINRGNYSFRCRARDNAGNIGEWSVQERTTVDSSAPTVNALFPDSVVQNRTMTIETTINDYVAIDSVSLFYEDWLHEYSQLVETSSGRWTVIWDIDTSQVQDNEYGSHSFTIITRDTNGNDRNISYNFNIVFCDTGESKVCGTETGVCSEGIVECNNLGIWGECQGSIGPSQEECNGLDDNCDGEIDDGIDCSCAAGEERECGTDTGQCHSGTQTCSEEGRWGECLNGIGPRPEECNGLDDDCNGIADDAPSPGCCRAGDPPQPIPGSTNTGICVIGMKTCNNGVWEVTTEPVYPGEEVCGNSLDDDCDGDVDETCETCSNGLRDPGEEGIDCGGGCPRSCDGILPSTDLILILLGSIVLVAIIILYLFFRSKGEELTWETLRKRWT
jgi:hypothetical protein